MLLHIVSNAYATIFTILFLKLLFISAILSDMVVNFLFPGLLGGSSFFPVGEYKHLTDTDSPRCHIAMVTNCL